MRHAKLLVSELNKLNIKQKILIKLRRYSYNHSDISTYLLLKDKLEVIARRKREIIKLLKLMNIK